MKKMKKKWGLILAPVAVIAICLSLIAGSTFALFTSEDKVNITVSAGTVAVSAKVENEIVKSPKSIVMNNDGNIDVAEELVTSAHASAEFTNGVLTVENLLAGDVVSFDLVISNEGDNANMQYAIECVKGLELMSAFDITIAEEEVGTFKKYTSAWGKMANGEKTVSVTMTLPVENESANGKGAEIAVTVFAVQENVTFESSDAVIEEIPEVDEFITDAESFVDAMQNGGSFALDSDLTVSEAVIVSDNTELNLMGNDLVVDNNKRVTVDSGATLTLSNGTYVAVGGEDVSNGVNNGAPIMVNKNSTLAMNDVDYVAYSGVYVADQGATVNVEGGSFTIANPYSAAIATNAGFNYEADVTIKDVTIVSVGAGILMNIGGNVVIDHCHITSNFQSVMIRGGHAEIKGGTTLINNGCQEVWDSFFVAGGAWARADEAQKADIISRHSNMLEYLENKSMDSAWKVGNATAFAAVAVGNYSPNQAVSVTKEGTATYPGYIAYGSQATCSIAADTVIKVQDGMPKVVVAGRDDIVDTKKILDEFEFGVHFGEPSAVTVNEDGYKVYTYNTVLTYEESEYLKEADIIQIGTNKTVNKLA